MKNNETEIANLLLEGVTFLKMVMSERESLHGFLKFFVDMDNPSIDICKSFLTKFEQERDLIDSAINQWAAV